MSTIQGSVRRLHLRNGDGREDLLRGLADRYWAMRSATDRALAFRLARVPKPSQQSARIVTPRAFQAHFRNVVGVTGIAVVMAGLALLFVQLVDVLNPQCIDDAQGYCAAPPNFTVPGLIVAGVGLVLSLGAALLSIGRPTTN